MNETEREEKFKEWLKGKVDTPGPILSYPRAMKILIPNELQRRNENKYGNLFSCTDLDYLNELYNRLLQDGDLHDFNVSTQRGVSSAAIRKYIEFLDPTNTTHDFISNNENGEPIMSKETKQKQPLNQILYGPPGTGKTYRTISKALEIIDGEVPQERKEAKKRFDELKNSGQIVFTTFHQSYGYEEFVEGIKAIPPGKEGNEDGKEMIYDVVDGIFKDFALSAKDNLNLTASFDFSMETCLNKFIEKVEESIAASGEYNIHQTDPHTVNFSIIAVKRKKNGDFMSFACKNNNGTTVFGLNKDIINRDFLAFKNGSIKNAKDLLPCYKSNQSQLGNAVYYFGLFQSIKSECEDELSQINSLIDSKKPEQKNYVLIIDEINRGNISKIFGELITLIEDSKRIGADEELRVKLPYSGGEFGVPQNLYIIGTMNTADRSIALMDTALRRRFHFEEMMPDSTTLCKKDGQLNADEAQKDDENDHDLNVDSVNIRLMLKKINERIEYLYDRDHQIGHAYFMSLKDKNGDEAKAELDNIFRNKIIPLLQEYFYDDWEKIQIVLGDHPEQFKNKSNIKEIQKYQFIQSIEIKEKKY